MVIQVITKAVGTAVREVVIKEATRAVTSPANPTSRAAVIQVIIRVAVTAVREAVTRVANLTNRANPTNPAAVVTNLRAE